MYADGYFEDGRVSHLFASFSSLPSQLAFVWLSINHRVDKPITLYLGNVYIVNVFHVAICPHPFVSVHVLIPRNFVIALRSLCFLSQQPSSTFPLFRHLEKWLSVFVFWRWSRFFSFLGEKTLTSYSRPCRIEYLRRQCYFSRKRFFIFILISLSSDRWTAHCPNFFFKLPSLFSIQYNLCEVSTLFSIYQHFRL